jgi:hypothetical protein
MHDRVFDRAETALICDCCQRAVLRVRGSLWHGQHRICVACFYVWYDEGITDPDVLGPEIVRRERVNAWPFPDTQLASV